MNTENGTTNPPGPGVVDCRRFARAILRHRIAWFLSAILLVLAGGLVSQADQSAEPIKATNVVILKKLVGQEVVVYGKIARTAKSRSGTQFLNFLNTELAVICAKEDLHKFTQGAPADLYNNKMVRVGGKLQLYKGKLQLKLSDPKAISIYNHTAAARTQARRVELKKVGPTHWVSPAGIVYRGRDPQGLTRVEHIERHVQDIPTRSGPHGVFDGDREQAFALIDEAWEIITKRKLKPNIEGNRSSYTVSMRRRIGYLGGTAGAARKHPPLSRLFIVVETGTKNIVTAFPR